MAEKKTTKPEVKATPAKAKVPVYIPKTGPGDDARYVAVNGKRILVQTGKTVYLEPKYAEVILNGMDADEKARQYIEDNAQF